MSLQNVRASRGMPFLRRGMRVHMTDSDRYGSIVSTRGDNLRIRIENSNQRVVRHPQWMMKYLDSSNNTIAEYQD